MTDVNPYQSPSAPAHRMVVAESNWASHPDERILFNVALTRRDVKRHFPKPYSIGWIAAGLVAFVGLVLLLGSSISDITMIIILIPVCIFFSIRLRLNWKYAIRQTPRLLSPVTGYINRDGLYTSSEGYQGFSRWTDLHAVSTSKTCALINGEGWRLVSLIIPWKSFEDPDGAFQALESVANQRKTIKPVLFGDERLLQEPTDAAIFQPPDPHSEFSGHITFGQIAASEPGMRMKRSAYRFLTFAIIAVIIGLILGCLALLLNAGWFCVAGFPLLVIATLVFMMLARHPMFSNKSDAFAVRSQGWFHEGGFLIQAATGQSHRQWNSVSKVWHDNSMMCIRLPGISDGWFFFARSQFASDEEFAQSCQWADAGLASATSVSEDGQ